MRPASSTLQQMVDVETVCRAQRNLGRRERKRQVAGGGQAAGIAEMQQILLAGAHHFGGALAGRRDALAHDERLAGRRLAVRHDRARHRRHRPGTATYNPEPDPRTPARAPGRQPSGEFPARAMKRGSAAPPAAPRAHRSGGTFQFDRWCRVGPYAPRHAGPPIVHRLIPRVAQIDVPSGSGTVNGSACSYRLCAATEVGVARRSGLVLSSTNPSCRAPPGSDRARPARSTTTALDDLRHVHREARRKTQQRRQRGEDAGVAGAAGDDDIAHRPPARGGTVPCPSARRCARRR